MEKISKKEGDPPIYVEGFLNEKEKTNLVFVHMSWGGVWAFENYIKYFAKKGYNCYGLDLRGHGKSGGTVEGATMNDYVDDVHTAVTSLNIERPVVLGHSMGGLIALMYGARYPTLGVVSIDGSPSIEVQKTSEEKTYKTIYTPKDSGMPSPIKSMFILRDIYPWRLVNMKMKLGVESGIARSERKKGISVKKEAITAPKFFVGAENGTSLPFGIGAEKVKAQATYYDSPFFEVSGASHPGILIGKFWKKSTGAILDWLKSNNL